MSLRLHWAEAEDIAGRRLDRRRSYVLEDGHVCELGSYSRECTGCGGHGCFECRGRGRRREWVSVPVDVADELRKIERGDA